MLLGQIEVYYGLSFVYAMWWVNQMDKACAGAWGYCGRVILPFLARVEGGLLSKPGASRLSQSGA